MPTDSVVFQAFWALQNHEFRHKKTIGFPRQQPKVTPEEESQRAPVTDASTFTRP